MHHQPRAVVPIEQYSPDAHTWISLGFVSSKHGWTAHHQSRYPLEASELATLFPIVASRLFGVNLIHHHTPLGLHLFTRGRQNGLSRLDRQYTPAWLRQLMSRQGMSPNPAS
jgi:hypothetical protein